jgi:hypothetical protein
MTGTFGIAMDKKEYMRALDEAYDTMDDRARRQLMRLFKRAAQDNPRELGQRPATLAPVVPLRRVVNQ